MEQGVREGNAEKVPFCVFYELFYYVPGEGGEKKKRVKNIKLTA